MTASGLRQHLAFRRLWAAQTLAQAGIQFSRVALPLVAIIALDATAFQAGLLATFQSAAYLVVGLPAGAWVDRLRKRPVLVAANVGRGLLLAWVPLASYLGILTLHQLYVVALGVSVLTVLFDTAYISYLPALLAPEQLVEGNAKLETTRSLAQVGGPSLGGYLVQWLTGPLAVLATAVGYLVSAGFLGRIRTREATPVRGPDRNLVREIREGMAFVFGNRLLRALAVSGATFNLGVYVTNTMVLVLLSRELGVPAGTIGLWFALAGLGGIAGAAVARRVTNHIGQGPAIWAGMLLAGVSGFAIPLAQGDWRLWLAGFGNALVSAGLVINNVNSLSFRQRLCSAEMQGRMSATIRFLVFGAMPVGSFLGGVLGDLLGVRAALWVGTVICFAAVFPVYLSPLRHMRELPTQEPTRARVAVPVPQEDVE